MTSERAVEPRTTATMRLREALDMERQTSQGNAMTPLRVAQFISGPWLDYIAEPYLVATPAPREDGWEELLLELADEIEVEGDLYVWPENKELAAKRVAALRLAAARGEPDE